MNVLFIKKQCIWAYIICFHIEVFTNYLLKDFWREKCALEKLEIICCIYFNGNVQIFDIKTTCSNDYCVVV